MSPSQKPSGNKEGRLPITRRQTLAGGVVAFGVYLLDQMFDLVHKLLDRGGDPDDPVIIVIDRDDEDDDGGDSP